jgi:hypothetical protein
MHNIYYKCFLKVNLIHINMNVYMFKLCMCVNKHVQMNMLVILTQPDVVKPVRIEVGFNLDLQKHQETQLPILGP